MPERKAKAKGGGLEVTAVVTRPDGVQYTICGGSVAEVAAAVEEVKPASAPAPSGGEPPQAAGGG
jgi:hypothetical protein